MDDAIERLRRFGTGAWALVGGFAVIAIIAWLFSKVRILWGPVLFATAIIYILNPVVTGLRKRGVPRAVGAVIAYLVAAAVIGVVAVVLVPQIVNQASALGDQLPVIYDNAVGFILDVAQRIGLSNLSLLSYEELVAQFSAPDEALRDGIEVFVGRAFNFALDLAEIGVLVFLTPVIAFYLLIDLPSVGRHVMELVPERARDEADALAGSLSKSIGGFVRGQLLVALIVGAISAFGLWAVGLDLWLILGLIAGLFNIIPFLGPWFSGLLAGLVALIVGDFRLALLVGMVFIVVQQLENHIITPLVMRATVKLHPSLIIMALLVGSSVGGFLGLVLAVPITALLRVLVSHFWRTRVLGESWEEASEAFTVEYNPPPPESLAGRLRRIGQMQLTRPAVHHHED